MGAKNTKLEDLNLDLDAIHRYEIDLSRGMLEADGDEGHRRLMKAVAPIGPYGLPLSPPPRSPAATALPAPAVLGVEMLYSVAEKWLSVYMKKCSPRRLREAPRQGHLVRLVHQGRHGRLIRRASPPVIRPTIDNKLMSISDLFK